MMALSDSLILTTTLGLTTPTVGAALLPVGPADPEDFISTETMLLSLPPDPPLEDELLLLLLPPNGRT